MISVIYARLLLSFRVITMVKDELVVKSNKLIEASYRLTLAEQRIVLFAISEAQRTNKGLIADDFITISAKDYAKMYSILENLAYIQLREGGKTLFDRRVTFHDIYSKTGKKRATEVRWLSADGIIQIRFAQDMIPYITKLEEQFTRYKLEKIAGMSSPYAIRLYELLMQWGSVGKRDIELKWLKKILVVEEEYPRLFDLKKRVIDVAVTQINQHSDINVNYDQRKTGRNVTHLLFTFAKKEESKKAIENPILIKPPETLLETPPETNFVFQLAKVPISPKLQLKYLAMRSTEEIILCLQRANEYGEQQEKSGKKLRYGALYRTAIEENWHVEQARKNAEKEEKEEKKQEATEQQRIAAEEKIKKEQEAENSKIQRKAIMESFKTWPDDEQTKIINEFIELNPHVRVIYKQIGTKSQLFIVPFVQFLVNR